MKALILITVQLFLGLSSVLSQEVRSSSGGGYSTFYGKIDFTIGETVINTLSNGTNFVTQGFHQPQLIVSSVEDFSENLLVNVFPNPVLTELRINLDDIYEGYQLSLIDINGKSVLTSPIKGKENSINVSFLSAGIYLLLIQDAIGIPLKSYQIHKLN
jgi:hypothetical protein